MSAIQLQSASPAIRKSVEELGDDDRGRIHAFLAKVDDYRGMVQRGDLEAAGRYHDTLMNEVRALREHYSDLKTYVAAGAGAGAVAGVWLFGVTAVAGGLAGGALGYFTAKGRRETMLEVCDALVVELGHRPS